MPRAWPLLLLALLFLAPGCALFPDITHEPSVHNPYPQLQKVAVLPFNNQSPDRTVNGTQVALAYYAALQQTPGFDVMDVGSAMAYLQAFGREPQSAADYQELARLMGVDAVVQGSVTDFSPYYPPRMGLSVNWYAANPSFHEIPAGYGLPWGTEEEEYIPDRLVFEAEFALAREQLKTQTPEMPSDRAGQTDGATKEKSAAHAGAAGASMTAAAAANGLPANWPDPSGFVPPAPCAEKPIPRPHDGPVMSYVRVYNGNNAEFTEQLANYCYYRDDARFGGWQGYLQRSDDFTRFCCYLHVSEMLAARGGAGDSRVVWRWPLGRYER